ncbi:MAG TPA: arginine deiminase family protein, partial [Thermoplasmata archaeon]|nr:arginine deiminase family protein [Thermoplasmata archaeon]
METGAHAEWHPLTDVVVHRPGIEMFLGLLEPYAFLFERAFSMDTAIYEHRTLEHLLRDQGVRVHRLMRMAVEAAKSDPKTMAQARAAAGKMVRYSGPADMVNKSRAALQRNLGLFDAETIF